VTTPRSRRSLSRSVGRLARQLERRLDEHGLTLAQYRVLSLLSEGSIDASRVADWLAVSPPSVTSVVDGLVARGFAERRAVPGDRRRQALIITGTGRTVLDAADADGDALFAEVATHMGAAAPELLAALATWGDALDRWRAARSRDAKHGPGAPPAPAGTVVGT